jgi:hypothetical protein
MYSVLEAGLSEYLYEGIGFKITDGNYLSVQNKNHKRIPHFHGSIKTESLGNDDLRYYIKYYFLTSQDGS